MGELVRIDDLVDHVIALHSDGDALVHLSDAVATSERLSAVADQLVAHFVDEARKTSATWAEIGRSLGVTRQAAQKRFGPKSADTGGLDAAT
ncbi:hypothetical protein ACQEVY_03460 [Streptomyces sp. CA-288835]|uniref:hypothetical protein n=1 Tax=Streptomyces sp. CA-288835 TaxID=3240069 RepID=UPI003D8AF997